MSKYNIKLALLFAFLFSLSFSVFAEDIQVLPANTEPRIIFYKNTNYGDQTFAVYGAGEISDLRDKDRGAANNWNDEISSIEFEGDFILTLFTDANYSGQSVTISTNQSNLFSIRGYDLDNEISSIRWEPKDPTVVQPQVVFYDDTNFRGNSFILYPGNNLQNLGDKRRGSRFKDWNDKIMSIKFIGTVSNVVLYDNKKYGGARLTISNSVQNLNSVRFAARASSVRVR